MIIRAFFRYRVHIIVLAGLLVMLPFRHSYIGIDADVQMAALAMTLLTTAGILTNKAADAVEDAMNPKSLILPPGNNRTAIIVASILFLAPIGLIAAHIYLLLAYLGLGALIYVFNYGISGHRLKSVLFVKNIAVAAIWTGITCLPYVLLAPDFNIKTISLSAGTAFLLMLCLDIFTDIRDIKGDAAANIKTIPVVFGINTAKGASLAAMIACVAWNYSFIPLPLPQLAGYAVGAAIVLLADPKRSYWHFQSLTFFWLIPALIDLLS